MEKILLADNNTVYGEGIKYLLHDSEDFSIIDFAKNKSELLGKIKILNPDILILDLDSVADINRDDISKLIREYPQTVLLVISSNKNKEAIYNILKSGIKNFIIKDCKTDEFLAALYAASAREKYFSSYIVDVLLNKKIWDSGEDNIFYLTNKEIEIIKLIAQGLTTKDIANKIFISHHTVNTHRKHILSKLGIKNTSELIMYAVRNGLIDTIEYYI
jgi:two-component system, NarL family, nitrate/nitrite response regulator NarL